MKKTPFFSVITASYNSEKTIARTIESLLNQSFSNFEYIIVDGNSKDNTLTIIESFAFKFKEKNILFKYVSEPDKGIYDAWNKGIKMSEGEWISFLGSDDYYLNNALDIYYKNIIKNDKSFNYISSKIEIIDEKNQTLSIVGKKFVWKNMLRNMDIAQVGSFHRKDLFKTVGSFSLDYKIVGDLDFYIRTKDKINALFLDTVTAKMQNNGVSNDVNKALREALKVRLKYKYLPFYINYFNHYITYLKCVLKNLIKK